ncbi:MAG TPA: porin family protein [Gemmatimonadales bacterium]|nr:porin family protein [Gemmatimonadales bacterium]
MRVRTLMISAGIALAVHGTMAAQTEFGVKAGASFGNIKNKGVFPGELKTRTGAAGGLFLGFRAKVIGAGIEAMYAQRGARSDQSINDQWTRLDYIDVPAYVKVSIPVPGIRPFIYAGPQVSFEVKCKTANGTTDCPDTDRKKTDYAGVIGAGVRLGGSSLGLSIEGRYVYGFSDLKLSTVTSSESYKNRTFMLLVGIGL